MKSESDQRRKAKRVDLRPARWSDYTDLLECMLYGFGRVGELVSIIFILSTSTLGMLIGGEFGGRWGGLFGSAAVFALVWVPVGYVLVRNAKALRRERCDGDEGDASAVDRKVERKP